MIELCVYSDLFFLQVPLCGPSQCAPVQKVCVPSLALKILQNGKTHLPEYLLPLQKKVFRLHAGRQRKLFMALGKHKLLLFKKVITLAQSVRFRTGGGQENHSEQQAGKKVTDLIYPTEVQLEQTGSWSGNRQW